MAGGLPIMCAYRPASTPEKVRTVPIPTTIVFRPAPLNTKSQRATWIQESKRWSQTLPQTTEQWKRRQLKVAQAQHRATSLPTSRQQCDAEEKAQAIYDTLITELMDYKLMWWVSCALLVINGSIFLVLFLILSTDFSRDSQGHQLGTSTTCDVVPSLTDGSQFSVLYWPAVVSYVILRLVAPTVAANVAALSEVLGQADAAYYRRQSECCIRVNRICGLGAIVAIIWGFVLMVRWKCEGDVCLNLALAAPAVMSWSLLASIVGVLFLESGYRVVARHWKRAVRMLPSEKELREEREAVGMRGSELLSQDEKAALEWV